MVHVRRNAIALSTAFVASPAFGWAADVPVRFCFVHVTSFTDAYDPVDGLPPLGDDYFLDSIMDVPARGVKGRVIDVGTPTEPGFNEVWSDFAYEDGSHVGCTPLLSIKEGHLVSVHTYTRAKIGSNSIRLTNDALEVFWFATSLDETVDQTWAAEPVTIPATGYLTPHSNIMAASEWALFPRRRLGE